MYHAVLRSLYSWVVSEKTYMHLSLESMFLYDLSQPFDLCHTVGGTSKDYCTG
jgi:hypothetical protein